MKVGCESCGASYSVADDKVAGRKLKMRCKKCDAEIIIDAVRADPPFGEADAAEVTPIGSAIEAPAEVEVRASWYIEAQDSAQGPFTLAEVSAQIADGRITGETLVFADGFSDWLRASEIPELRVSLVTIPPLPGRALPPLPTAPAIARSEIAGPTSMGSDPFGEPAARPVSGISPRVSSDEIFSVGLQREGTVQFSIDQIRALSAVSSSSVAPAAPAKPGFASGDGSGLIDMRSLYENQPEEAYRPITGMMASPLDTMAPLTLPQSSVHASSGIDLRTKVLAGLAALGFVSAAVVAALALSRPEPAAVSAAAMPPVQPTLPAPQAEPAPAAVKAVVEAAAEPAAAQPEAEAVAEGDEKPAAASSRRATAGRTHKKAAAGEAAAVAAAPARSKPERSTVDIDDLLAEKPKSADKAAKPAKGGSSSIDDLLVEKPKSADKAAKPAAKGGSSSIDDLLDSAVSDKKAPVKAEPAAAAASALPETPTRDQMKAAFGKANAKAAQCKGTGVAIAVITVAGSGKASKVVVSGVEGPAKSCVESAVRATAFPKFQKDSFEVKFPFKLAGA